MTRRPLNDKAFAVLLLAAIAAGYARPQGALAASPALTESAMLCFERAGSSLDKGLPDGIKGVTYGDLQAEAAIEVCAKANAENPDNAVIEYTYARALQKSGVKLEEAARLYQSAVLKGHILAMNNLGQMYEFGEGVELDIEKAFVFYTRAAASGLAFAEQNIARHHKDGIGRPADAKLALVHYLRAREGGIDFVEPIIADLLYEGGNNLASDPVEAAAIWRKLALSGDKEAAYKVVKGIDAKKISPADGAEYERLFEFAASGDNFEAIRRYASRLAENPTGEAAIKAALEANFRALDVANQTPIGQDGSFPVYRRWIGKNIVTLVNKGVVKARDEREFEALRSDYGADGTKRFTVPMTCNGVKGEQHVYVWDWSRSESPMESQAAYYNAAGCEFPADVLDSFKRLYEIAREKSVSYVELSIAAFSTKNVNDENKSDLLSGGKYNVAYELRGDGKYQKIITLYDGRGDIGDQNFQIGLNCDGKQYITFFRVPYSSYKAKDLEGLRSAILSAVYVGTPCEQEKNGELINGVYLQSIFSDIERWDNRLYSAVAAANAIYGNLRDGKPPEVLFWRECLKLSIERLEGGVTYEDILNYPLKLDATTKEVVAMSEREQAIFGLALTYRDALAMNETFEEIFHLPSIMKDYSNISKGALYKYIGSSIEASSAIADCLYKESGRVDGIRLSRARIAQRELSGIMEYSDSRLVNQNIEEIVANSEKDGGGWFTARLHDGAASYTLNKEENAGVAIQIDVYYDRVALYIYLAGEELEGSIEMKLDQKQMELSLRRVDDYADFNKYNNTNLIAYEVIGIDKRITKEIENTSKIEIKINSNGIIHHFSANGSSIAIRSAVQIAENLKQFLYRASLRKEAQ